MQKYFFSNQNLLCNIFSLLTVNSSNLKKLKATIETVIAEKAKQGKEKNKKSKGKGKVRLMVEGDNVSKIIFFVFAFLWTFVNWLILPQEYSAYGAAEYDDFDDFI